MTLTQILQKIKSAFYTKSETDSKLNAKANSSDLNNYLPLSGGTMTGTVIARSVDDSVLQIRGATAKEKGAHLSLFGESSAESPGAFAFVARTQTKFSGLLGTPDGSLTWGGKSIDVIEEQGNGYIRYSNGVQICWGQANCSIDATETLIGIDVRAYYGLKYVNFSSAFKDGTSPYCTVTVIDTEYGLYGSSTYSMTNALVAIEIYGPNHSVSLDVQYIAIGRWK